MTLEELFAHTNDERNRLANAPFARDENAWLAFARHILDQVLAAYAAGEISLERCLRVMRSCSLGCKISDRIKLLAVTSELALRETPRRTPGKRRDKNPVWVRNSAATLVEMLHEDRPHEPIAPHEHNGWTTPILEDAIRWLVALKLCEPVDTRTIYRWYLDGRATQSGPPSSA